MPVKWIALAIIFLSVPALAAWLRTNPRRAPVIWFLLGVLPFVLGPWHLIYAPYSTPTWPGYVKGWEISVLDAVALGIILGNRDQWPKLYLLTPLIAYLFAVIVSTAQARFGALAWSYVIQLIRVIVVYIAVARVVVSDKGERAVLMGLVAGLAVQALYAILAHIGGALQTGGSLGHQNLLGLVSHMVVMPAFAVLLGGRWTRIGIVGILAGAVAVILTASRATIGLSAVGLAVTLIISMAMRMSPRKSLVGITAVIFLAASFPFARSTLQRRFEAQKTTFFTEDLEREAFKRAAWEMIAAKPMGVGPNHYVFIANTEGYSARAGVAWRTQSRSTNVHNTYLLTAAETGYLGLASLLWLLAASIWTALATAARFRRSAGSDHLIGVAVGIGVMAAHGLYEWTFVVYPSAYIFAISLGLIAGLRTRFIRGASRKSHMRGVFARLDRRDGPLLSS